MKNFARAVGRHGHRTLRVLSLLLFCVITVSVPQIKVRAAESTTIELLPGDSSGGSGQEESTETHVLLERSSSSRWRSYLRILPATFSSSQACPVRLAQDEIFVLPFGLSERVLPLRI